MLLVVVGKMTMRLRNYIMIFSISFFLLVCLLVAVIPKVEPTPKTPAEQALYDLESAMIRCKNHARDSVADNDRMDFAAFGAWLVTLDGADKGYQFTFDFKAKNVFGVLIPATMFCHVVRSEGSWDVIDLRIL